MNWFEQSMSPRAYHKPFSTKFFDIGVMETYEGGIFCCTRFKTVVIIMVNSIWLSNRRHTYLYILDPSPNVTIWELGLALNLHTITDTMKSIKQNTFDFTTPDRLGTYLYLKKALTQIHSDWSRVYSKDCFHNMPNINRIVALMLFHFIKSL